MTCSHQAPKDHKRAGEWVCTTCGNSGSWGRGWVYFGNCECRTCGLPEVKQVWCPDCSGVIGPEDIIDDDDWGDDEIPTGCLAPVHVHIEIKRRK